MEDGYSFLASEDGDVEVECLLVEPQDGHVSIDGFLHLTDKSPEIALEMEEVFHRFGGPISSPCQPVEDIMNQDVLGRMPSEDDGGYFQSPNNLYTACEDYFLGIEFGESITNLDYGSSGGLQNSILESRVPCSNADTCIPWGSDCLGGAEISEFLHMNHSEFSDTPSCREFIEEKQLKPLASSTLHDIGKLQDISRCSPEGLSSDENEHSPSASGEIFCELEIQKNKEFRPMCEDTQSNSFHEQDACGNVSVQASSVDASSSQKRLRKPTRRYIDEVEDSVPRYTNKRRDSMSTSKDKVRIAKNHEERHLKSKAMRFFPDESSAIAIQVPFVSEVQKDSQESHASDMVITSNDIVLVPKNESVKDVNRKKRNRTGGQKKKDNCLKEVSVSHKNKIGPSVAVSQKKKVEHSTITTPEEDNGRRKHHRLWTISEVTKLIDGVSQYGVGKWSRIKRLFFSTSAHRTSVDLKDKWRNLLKASYLQEEGMRQGEKKRNLAWRPLPKSILRRVCELAAMYPYPRGRKLRAAHTPNKNADMTLSDYKRIIRCKNDN